MFGNKENDMWMDEIVLKTSVSANGSSSDVPQEIRVSVEDGQVYLRCSGLFSVSMSENEFENLVECVDTLHKLEATEN